MTLDLEKLRSIGFLSRGRTMSRATSGREHPDSGLPYQTVRDELGNDVTEHGRAGSGLSERQDVEIHADTVHHNLGEASP
jgi:hypothetical protein